MSLIEFGAGLSPQSIAAGETLIAQGDYSGAIYVLIEGSLEIFKNDIQVATIDTPGALIGEMSALTGQPHSASVRAARETTLYIRPNGKDFLAAHPQLLFPVAQMLAERLFHSTEKLAGLSTGQPDTIAGDYDLDKALRDTYQDAKFVFVTDIPFDIQDEMIPPIEADKLKD